MELEDFKKTDLFVEIDYVVADDKRFIHKLGVGPEVYSSLRFVQGTGDAFKVTSAATAGAAIASSGTVAATFFAGSGWLAAIGLGAAAVTPIGWVITAAVMSGGTYYGVLKAYRAYEAELFDTIPRWINTPIDLIGAAIIDMLGGVALCVARADGEICEAEREHIRDYFVEEWGIDRAYSIAALGLLEENLDNASLQERVAGFLAFAEKNPDCNVDALGERVRILLEALIASDGRVERAEEDAVKAVMRQLQQPSETRKRAIPNLRQTWLGRSILGLTSAGSKEES
jgi:uncharacterized tellurite resistance protein B-like protein